MRHPFSWIQQRFQNLRFRHLAFIQVLELLLLSSTLPNRETGIGNLVIFLVLVPLQFFNRLLGLRLMGESPQKVRRASRLFVLLTLIWGLIWFTTDLRTALKPLLLISVAILLTMMLARFISSIWKADQIHGDLIWAVIICYASLALLGYLLHTINFLYSPQAYELLPGIPYHSQMMGLSIGGTTTTGAHLQLKNSTSLMIFNFQALLSQLFLVVFVARVIGLSIAHERERDEH